MEKVETNKEQGCQRGLVQEFNGVKTCYNYSRPIVVKSYVLHKSKVGTVKALVQGNGWYKTRVGTKVRLA